MAAVCPTERHRHPRTEVLANSQRVRFSVQPRGSHHSWTVDCRSSAGGVANAERTPSTPPGANHPPSRSFHPTLRCPMGRKIRRAAPAAHLQK
eukprot:9856437-Alexandrium_andersonii.AAC.1